jgi:iron-sulfur cluster insertion protein
MLKSLWDDFRGVEVNPPPKNPGIIVTESARKKIAEMCLENDMVAVRPYVYGGGCSGMAHSMTFVEEKEKRDTEVFEYMYIDPVTSAFMEGATIDYDTAGMNPTFVFHDVFKEQGGSGTCGGCGAATGPGYEPH